MKFIQGDEDSAVKHIAQRLTELLREGKPVLWLVSGGSNIPIQTAAMDLLPPDLTRKLTIMPVDERYGRYNHLNSNAAQMRRHGFDPKRAEWIDILENNDSLDQTRQLLNDYIAREIAVGDYVFATLGLGAEGHIAGIMPHSPALHCTDFVVAYTHDDFTRITLCADALAAHCMEVFVCAFGDKKHEAVRRLADHTDERENWPGDLLHEVTDCTVYNDFLTKEVV